MENTNNEENVFTWEMLNESRIELSKDIIKQQIMVSEFIKLIANDLDEELSLMIKGLMNSIIDLANDVREISLLHSTVTTEQNGMTIPVEFKTGVVDSDSDEYFDYLKYSNGYIAISEKLAHLIAVNYMDIATRIKAPKITKELNKIREDGVKTIKKATKEAEGGIDGK